MNVTIQFSGNSFTKQYDAGTTVTVSSIIRDRNLQAALGFGANVEAQLNGATLANDTILNDGDEITIVTKANAKAA